AASAASAGAGALGLAGVELEHAELEDAEPTQSVVDPSSATVEDDDFSQMETVEEDDTIAFQGADDTLIDDNAGLEELSEESIAIDGMEHAEDNSDQLAAMTPESMSDDDLSEFMLEDDADDIRGSKPAEVMMDVTSRRRRKSGSPIKTILGVAVGGMLSLPIVGTILHFLGQDIPVISDVLPRLGGSSTAVRANTPMPLDNFEPRIVEDDMQSSEPVTGRSIGDELSDETAGASAPDPTASALEEITGAPVMAADTGNPIDSFTPPADDSFGGEPTAIEDIGAGEMVDPTTNGDFVETATDEMGLPDSFSPELPVAESGGAASGLDLPGAGSNSDDLFGDSSPIEEMPSEEGAAGSTDMSLPTLPEAPAFDVTAKIAQVSSALDSVYQMDANDPQRGEQIQNAYESLSRLASEVPADSMSQLQPVLRDLASNTGVVVAFAKTTPEWIAKTSEERGGDGALVVGKMSGGPGAETFLLSNKQEVPVTLPPNIDSAPSGIQIGLGQVLGSGRNATLSLELLQGVSQ
ncbi:MAG: hypothetical protein ACF787_04355, partial [Rhodopirellula sp. JB053]